MATNSYGWASPNYATPTAQSQGPQYSTNMIPPPSPQVPQSTAFHNYYGGGANDILAAWRGQQPGGDPTQVGQKDWTNPSFYANEGNRNLMEGYTNYYAVPYGNLALAQQTQDFNQSNAISNFNEQQRVNTGQLDLAYRGSGREDQALAFGQFTNQRDYEEAVRQANQQYGLSAELGRGQLSATNYANQTQRDLGLGQISVAQEQNRIDNMYKSGQLSNDQYANATNRLNANNQYTLGQQQNANQLLGLQNDYALGQGQNANQRYATDVTKQLGVGSLQNDATRNQNDFTLGQGNLQNQQYANQTQRTDVNNNYLLGQGSLQNQQFANQAQAARYSGQTANEQFANQTALTGVQNQYALGQGQLGYQNRQLDTTNSFNQQQLAQEADLTREKYKNDLMNTRLAATGRVAPVNQRAIRQWY